MKKISENDILFIGMFIGVGAYELCMYKGCDFWDVTVALIMLYTGYWAFKIMPVIGGGIFQWMKREKWDPKEHESKNTINSEEKKYYTKDNVLYLKNAK